MPAGRLPKLVWQHNWQEGRRQGGQVKMWDAHTEEVAKSVGMEELAVACADADGYGAYKKQVSMAVRKRDMQVAQADALHQSTLARYLPMLGPDATAVPNTMQPYLAGIGPTVKTRLKLLQFRSGTAAVAHRKELVTRHSRRHQAASSQCPCCGHADETHQHVVLHCPHHAAVRAQLHESLMSAVGEEKVRCWESLDDERRYQALLSDFYWGADAACVVDEIVQEYLYSLWDARQLVIRGQSASDGAGSHGLAATGTAQ